MLVVSGEKAGTAAQVIKIEDQVASAGSPSADVSKATGKQPAIEREDYDNPNYEIHPDADTARPSDANGKPNDNGKK